MTTSVFTQAVHPVVGVLTPYLPELGGKFGAFETDTMMGLAMVTNRRIDLLAINAKVHGRGDFSRFLKDLKRQYAAIGVWEIMNPVLKKILEKKGFRPVTEFVDGDRIAGMRWDLGRRV